MSGVKVTNERPARAIPAVESVDGSVDDDDVDWTPDTTTGIPPGTDAGDVLTWDGDSWEPEPPGSSGVFFELKNEGGQSFISAHGSMGSTETIDPTDGNVHTGTLTADCTITLNAPTGSGSATLVGWFTEDSTGGWDVIWPGSVTEEGTHDTTPDTTQRVVLESVDGGTSWIATWVGGTSTGGGGSTTLPWFIVTDPAYGAVGDGSTDDTSAINAAIADLNSAGQGVLYFPAAVAYKVTSALTTITAVCTIMGDGGAGDPIYSSPISQIRQTSATANVFTISGSAPTIRDLSIRNTNAGTPSAGTAISLTNAQWARMERLTISRFYDNISIDNGPGWSLNNSFIYDPVRYGIRIRGVISFDSGDQSIVGCYFMSDTHAGTAAIRQESAGGLKVVNTKINARGGTSQFVTGFSGAFGVLTAVLTITGCSFENMSGDAIAITTTSAGCFGLISITGCQFGLYSNNSGRPITLTADTNGDFGDAGSLSGAILDGLMCYTNGTARSAIQLVNTDRVTIGSMQLDGFNARYSSSGDTNTTDGGAASLSDHTHAATGTGSNGGGATLQPGTFDFPAATSPAQTAEGRAVWDSDDDKLTIGTGAARKTLVNEGSATASGLTMATARLLGRTTASTGAIEEITVGSGLTLSAGALTATGGSVAALDDLTDVTISTPTLADKLRYNGSVWANSNLHDEPMIASDGSVMTDGLLNPMMHEVPW